MRKVLPAISINEPTQVGESGTRNLKIRLVHTRVRGRVRLNINRLYRSPQLKQQLEQGLRGLPGIRSVQASVLTGNLLVVFDPARPVDDILGMVHSQLGIERSAGASRRARAAGGSDIRETLSHVVDLFTQGLRSPVAAAVSGAALSPGGGAGDTSLVAAEEPGSNWHRTGIKEAIAALDTSSTHGLSAADAAVRLAKYGPNALPEPEARSNLSIFLEQFNSLPVALLGVSAVVSVMTGGTVDAIVILVVVVINAIIGFFTERAAERTIRALTGSKPQYATVVRDAEAETIPIADLVPGDLILLNPGSYVPADVRLMQTDRLSVDESPLTGESVPVTKDADFMAEADSPLGDRKNMAFMGTMCTGGTSRGIVVSTAMSTELGNIQSMITTAEVPETPMERQLDHMGTQLAVLSGVVCAGVGVVGLLRGQGWIPMLKSSVALAVAAVPEGLPAVATTTLALGIKEMRKRRVAVRHLDAVENLGSVQIFCLDKTGTLTLNHMTVVALHTGDRRYTTSEGQFLDHDGVVDPGSIAELRRLLEVVSLCSETALAGDRNNPDLEGSPTENALVESALRAGIDVRALREQNPRLELRERAEGRPLMSTQHNAGRGRRLMAVKGSPAEVLALCTRFEKGGEVLELDEETRKAIIKENERMAGDALRVLGVAYVEGGSKQRHEPENLIWLGLTGMADPLRTGMPELMSLYHRAGIRTVMITGDQTATAAAIGKQLNLSGDKPLEVLDSTSLDKLDPELLAGLIKKVNVFARVSPAHKLKIVQALQRSGFVVAMTGDGINDGPALKASDVGVAMGKTGTDVARSVADVVLQDDNLGTMAVAVEQGRTIYRDVRKTIHFMVATNVAEIEIMLAGIAMGYGEVMNPMQLLWINLFTDIFPGLALSLEPAEPGVMERPPRDPSEEIIRKKDLIRMLEESAIIGAGTLGAYFYGVKRYGGGLAPATLAFNTLTIAELFHSIRSRSNQHSIYHKKRMPPNKYLNWAVGGTLAVQIAANYIPPLRTVLGASRLGLVDFAVVFAGAGVPFFINEAVKHFTTARQAPPAIEGAYDTD